MDDKITVPIDQMQAALELIADDIIWLSRVNDKIEPFVMANDFFVPAADGEDIEWNELPGLLEKVKSGGEREGLRWVAEKRGVPFVYWRDNPKLAPHKS